MNKNVYASRGAAGRRASLVEAVSRRASFIEQLNKEFAGWQETTFGNVNKRQNSFKREYDVEENSLRAFMCKVVEVWHAIFDPLPVHICGISFFLHFSFYLYICI